MPGIGVRSARVPRVVRPRTRRSITQSVNAVVQGQQLPTWYTETSNFVPWTVTTAAPEPTPEPVVEAPPEPPAPPPVVYQHSDDPSRPTLRDTHGDQFGNRLRDTICKYKGKWVYLQSGPDPYYLRIGEAGSISYYEMEPWTGTVLRLDYRKAFTEDFEFGGHKLGYMNTKDSCWFVSKRLGSSGSSVGLSYLGLNWPRNGSGNSWYKDQGFVDMLNGVYDTPQNVLDIVGVKTPEKMLAKAFSSKACFVRKSLSVVSLYYMGDQVGEALVPRTGTNGVSLNDIYLYESYGHLKSYFTSLGFTPNVYTE